MAAVVYLLALLAGGTTLRAEGTGNRQASSYSAASIVNAASNVVGALAPNTIATIYGTNLSYGTSAASGNAVPTELAGVRVAVGGVIAVLYYVSPGQVNLVIPSMLRGPEAELVHTLEGKAGPVIKIPLLEAAPALFQWGENTVVATRPDWTPITVAAPAGPGEWVILFATGLGETVPETVWGQRPAVAAPIKRLSEFRVMLGEAVLEPGPISYAGVAPGFPGLYQINLKLPEQLPDDPEIRITLGDQISPPGLRLPVRNPTAAQPASLPVR